MERLVLDKNVFNLKNQLSQEYANMIYNGLWYSPLRNALDAFMNETQVNVTGLVKIKLYKGGLSVAGRTSPHSLYNRQLATYTEEDRFDHKASEGFIKIYSLPVMNYYKQKISTNGNSKIKLHID